MWKYIVISALFSLLVFNTGLALDLGSEAPEIALTSKDGEQVNLSSLKGKIVLIDFWASWCHPCREANPFLVDAYLKYHHKGFEILSVSLDEDKKHWVDAIEHDKLPWKLHVSDFKGWESKVITDYKVEALPTSYLIDRDGKVVALDPFAEDLELELQEIFMKEISFYPKNVSTKLYLSIPTKYQIRDAEGKKLLKGEGDVIDVSTLSPGVFEIEFAGKTEKFLKKGVALEAVKVLSHSNDKITFSRKSAYSIHAVDGKKISEGDADFVSIAQLPSGEYYLHLSENVERILKK